MVRGRIEMLQYRPRGRSGLCRIFKVDPDSGATVGQFDLPDDSGHLAGLAYAGQGRLIVATVPDRHGGGHLRGQAITATEAWPRRSGAPGWRPMATSSWSAGSRRKPAGPLSRTTRSTLRSAEIRLTARKAAIRIAAACASVLVSQVMARGRGGCGMRSRFESRRPLNIGALHEVNGQTCARESPEPGAASAALQRGAAASMPRSVAS